MKKKTTLIKVGLKTKYKFSLFTHIKKGNLNFQHFHLITLYYIS